MTTMVPYIHGVAMMRGACPLSLSSLPHASYGGERNGWSRALRARPVYFIGAGAEARA